MSLNQAEEPLEYLVKTFNTFIQQAVQYLNSYTDLDSSLSQSLYDILLLWIHPQGVINLVKTINFGHSNDPSFPQVTRPETLVPQTRWSICGKIQEVIEPECTPQKPQMRVQKQVTSRINQFSEEVIQNQSEQEVESINVKKEEGFQSSYSQSFSRLYKRGPYKSYTHMEKLRAVSLFMSQKLTVAEISKQLGIPCKNIKRWATEGINRKRGGGRKRTNPFLESQIYKWLIENYARGQSISINQIQQYALSRANDQTFKASRGWAIKFIERHHLRHLFSIV